jgi:DMSO/TMAO reductase YedYZ molybdopterin-dependent catalytic subunit
MQSVKTPRWTLSQLPRLIVGAASGLLAAAAALGAGQLAAALTGPLGSPVVAVGDAAISLTPVPVKEFAIAHFGSHDKDALLAGIVTVILLCAVLAGIVAMRRLPYGLAVLAAFAVAGVVAALTRPQAAAADVFPTLAGTAAACAALVVLTQAARAAFPSRPASAHDASAHDAPAHDAAAHDAAARDTAARDTVPGRSAPGTPGGAPAAAAGPDRRRLLVAGAGVAAFAAAGGVAGQSLLGRFNVAGLRSQVRLPAAAIPASPVPAGARLAVPGLTPFFTANSDFYRVDTDLVLPQVSPDTWSLLIDGMVTRPVRLTFGELLRMPLTEADITLVCVSNQVGGPYAGNARWLGVPLAGLLRRAGIRAGADQVLSTGTDGMTISTPLQTILDGRDALVAVGMNGQPLPVAHGFPARMVVPGLYGYVSATKWVTRLTVTTFAAARAYWTQRGYTAQAPIKTESRIDVPRPLARVPAGPVTVAGVAWAPARGIAAVEVSADGGSWQQARLAAADGADTWRQWMWTWQAAPGLHRLQVRATDSRGVRQTPAEAASFPDGASGWDSVVVTVT